MFATKLSMGSLARKTDEPTFHTWIWAFPTTGKSTLAKKFPAKFFDPELTPEGIELVQTWQKDRDESKLEAGMKEVIANQAEGRIVLTNWHRPEQLGLEQDMRIGPLFILPAEEIKARFDKRNPGHDFTISDLESWVADAEKGNVEVYTMRPDEYLEQAIRSALMDKITIPEA